MAPVSVKPMVQTHPPRFSIHPRPSWKPLETHSLCSWLVILKVSSLPIPQPCIISFRQPQRLCANSQQTSTSQIFLTATHHFSWLFTCRLPFFHRQNIQTPSFSPQQSCYIISAFTLSCHSPGFLSFHSCFVIRNPQDPVRLSKQAIWFSSHLASQRMFIISCFNNH